MDYIVVNDLAVPIKESEYPNSWQIVHAKAKGLYVLREKIEKDPNPNPIYLGLMECRDIYRLKQKGDGKFFSEWYNAWLQDTLVQYRGFAGCHWCWPRLLKGELEPDGSVDKPDWSMSEEGRGKSRWLPTDFKRKLPQTVGIGDTDALTRRVLKDWAVPVQFTVEIPAGRTSQRKICWTGSGEQVVRGPLYLPAYRLTSILVWVDPDFFIIPWPQTLDSKDLPPQRPFKPTLDGQIVTWWNQCKPWLIDLAAASSDYIPYALLHDKKLPEGLESKGVYVTELTPSSPSVL